MVALNDGANHRSCDESMRGPCVTIWRCTLAAKRFRNAALCVPATCTACSSRSNSLPGQFSRMHSRADAASAMPEAEGIKCTLMLPSTGFLHNWIGDAAHTCSVSIVVRLKPRQLCPEPPPRHPGLLPRPQMGIFPLKDPSSGYVDSEAPCQKKSNVEKHVYVLGINAYDHDDSACLLRDGEIAYAIAKERITRKKHDTGFYQKVVDYCLAAEGISLDDVDLVVRNCYVLPVEDLEIRMVSQDVPEVMDAGERTQAEKNSLYLSKSDKVVTVSHHLAHAYSAFAACPFNEGVVMVVDGVGNYSSDITEPGQLTDNVNPLADQRGAVAAHASADPRSGGMAEAGRPRLFQYRTQGPWSEAAQRASCACARRRWRSRSAALSNMSRTLTLSGSISASMRWRRPPRLSAVTGKRSSGRLAT